MSIIDSIQNGVIKGIKSLYGADITADQITMNSTRKEFEGDYTVVAFPFARIAKKKPDQIAEELGAYLVGEVEPIEQYNVIKGFLNLSLSHSFWREFLAGIYQDASYGRQPANGQKVMVEFSSPNTNKPLHLGHIRNILLGWSASRILEAAGYEVVRVQIINDRGIAICKSMLAWQKFGKGATPASAGEKGDHFVGDYYVLFEKKLREEYQGWQQSEEARKLFETKADTGQAEPDFFKAFKNTYFNEYSSLGAEAKQMLLQWEAGDPATKGLWKQMNDWVYQGFDETYKQLGVEFDQLYFESETYLLGKDAVQKGLEKGLFYQKEDGSVWIDLTDANLDQKLVLRSDGTSVYMTQDIGTAQKRYQDFGVDKMVYVVANEQNYHFQALFEILKRLGEPYAHGLYHLSYGMVDLPTGKMKSREGTVVDADDLIAEVVEEARKNTADRDTISGLSEKEQEEVIRQIAIAALKFFIIKVQPQKRMVFDPKESVDLQGQTGPYVQNAYVRVQSVLRKAGDPPLDAAADYQQLEPQEKEMLNMVYAFPALVKLAAEEYDPSGIANFCYDLAKAYHRFYHDLSILNAKTAEAKAFRLQLSQAVAIVLKQGLGLLGIEMPERM
ncbi:MAG: arginine--tRNA ligase [Lewinellaceae bacterium]|nr:arginine--tRNA ligase [Phaeodactylibacter sp.]MCB0612673.1 arginine--tRNA ligase [Phaeodactylibacter sp.]MCB9350794.1 arginine--tRNA ligase [Lewinellaceae bacterium]